MFVSQMQKFRVPALAGFWLGLKPAKAGTLNFILIFNYD
jgi:hypothetical protein